MYTYRLWVNFSDLILVHQERHTNSTPRSLHGRRRWRFAHARLQARERLPLELELRGECGERAHRDHLARRAVALGADGELVLAAAADLGLEAVLAERVAAPVPKYTKLLRQRCSGCQVCEFSL